MNTVLNFFAAHPLLWQLGALPLVTALVTWVFKPRSPEQYAALPPRVAATLKLIAAVGWDAPKILEAIGQLVSGRALSAAAERAAKGLLVVGMLGAIAGGTSACASATPLPTTPRAQARAVIRVLADAVHDADAACADVARQRLDADLADSCDRAYTTARAALLIAGDGVDAWDTAQQGPLSCRVLEGAAAAEQLLGDLESAHVEVPASLTDGLSLLHSVSISCSSATDAGADSSSSSSTKGT